MKVEDMILIRVDDEKVLRSRALSSDLYRMMKQNVTSVALDQFLRIRKFFMP